MIKSVRRGLKWFGIFAGLAIAVFLLILGILTNPGLFFPEEKQYGAITVYSELPIGGEIDSVMAEVFERLDAVPIYDRDRNFNVCICSTQSKFSFFSRLKRGPTRIMGFNVWGNCYVNGDLLRELAVKTGGRPKYMARGGSIVHIITHELMHGYLSDAYGIIASRRLPEWKSEGYCEYGVNHFVAPRDSGYTIGERIDVFRDDVQWNEIASTHRGHYIWGLMMEYLINVKGMNLEQVMADSVTLQDVYNEIMAWHENSK